MLRARFAWIFLWLHWVEAESLGVSSHCASSQKGSYNLAACTDNITIRSREVVWVDVWLWFCLFSSISQTVPTTPPAPTSLLPPQYVGGTAYTWRHFTPGFHGWNPSLERDSSFVKYDIRKLSVGMLNICIWTFSTNKVNMLRNTGIL